MNFTVKKIITYAGTGLFLLGVLLFSYLGNYNRYWADDWCYNADFKQFGLSGTLQGYTYITTYASNRFSLTLFSGWLYKLGVIGVQLMTPLAILLWLAALYWILANFLKIRRLSWTPSILLFTTSSLLYYALYLTPHPYQSLYWRSGLLPYTAPLVFSLCIIGMLTQQARLDKPSHLILVLIAPLAFLTGGFSEAGCAFLVTALALYLIAAVAGIYRHRPWAQKSFPAAGLSMLFALLAMGVLIFSPTSAMRMSRYGAPTSLTRMPYVVTWLSLEFVRLSFKDFPLPHLILPLTFSLLGFTLTAPLASRPAGDRDRAASPKTTRLHVRNATTLVVLIAAVAFLLIAASYAPSAYIEHGPPALRTRIIPRFILLAALASIAWVMGSTFRQLFTPNWLVLLATVPLFFAYLYAGRSIWITGDKITLYSERATQWDRRDQQIRQLRQAGQLDLEVQAIDGYPVGGLRDLKLQPTHWVNACAERYYGVNAISAR